MATLEEQQQLIDTLKFTPRTYKISMWGYGGERVMGTVSQESYNYCLANQVDLQDIAWNSEAAEEMGLDADLLPFPPGSWYECDNLAHCNGVAKDSGTLQIEDETGETVAELNLEDLTGDPEDGSPEFVPGDEAWITMRPGSIVFHGSSNEKGTFFEGEIELTAPFDITKLSLHYDEIDGEEIVTSVSYDGEDIDNWGGGTDGKSSDFSMFLVKENGDYERYNPEEKDWGHPEYGTSPSEWERTPKFDFKKHKPVYPGYYTCVWSDFGTTYGSAYWDGKEFGEWEYGKFKPISGVQTWSGYTWDTTDWANRPPEPPDVGCDDKKCGWVGSSDDRRTDDDYTDHCPACDGTEFSWIDYDPDTAKGRKNREKYCEPTEEEAAFMAELDRALIELAKEVGIDFNKGEE